MFFIIASLPRPTWKPMHLPPRAPGPPQVVYVQQPLPEPTKDDCIALEEAEHKRKLDLIADVTDPDLKAALLDQETARHDFVLAELAKRP
jgi:hypothetical protein